MTQIDYFLAIQSPFVYLAGTRPAEIARKHGATLVYRPLDVLQLYARTGGKPREERHPSRQSYSGQDRVRLARKLGLPMQAKPLYGAANPAPASYAIVAAQAAGGGDITRFVTSLSRALWEQDRDISEDEVIRALLAEAGFDPAVADRGMLRSAEAYGANLEEAVARGVFGVPFFVVGEERFWGQDRLEDLDLHLAGKL